MRNRFDLSLPEREQEQKQKMISESSARPMKTSWTRASNTGLVLGANEPPVLYFASWMRSSPRRHPLPLLASGWLQPWQRPAYAETEADMQPLKSLTGFLLTTPSRPVSNCADQKEKKILFGTDSVVLLAKMLARVGLNVVPVKCRVAFNN